MKIQYFGHSTFSLSVGDFTLLFDPFISPNPLASSIDIETIKADYILVSHGHFDHVADLVQIAKRTQAKCISNFEIYEWLATQGVSNTHPMNLGGSFMFPFGLVKLVNAVHSSTLPGGAPGGHPGGFVVETASGTIYFSGDTALTRDMELIGERFKIDLAVLCIGDNFTMGPEDAAQAALMVGATKAMGVHYDTFPPIVINHAAAKAVFEKSEVELLLPAIGETLEIC